MHRLLRIIAALLLLAHASTGTALIPAAVAALADLDGSHAVIVCHTASGTQVILHHRPGEYTPAVCDHALLGRMAVRLCQPSRDGDHNLATPSAAFNAAEDSKREIKTADACVTGSLPALHPAACQTRSLSLRKSAVGRAPPDRSGLDVHRAIKASRLLI